MSFLHYKMIYPDKEPRSILPHYNDLYDYIVPIVHAPPHKYNMYHYQPRYIYSPYAFDSMYHRGNYV